MLCFSSVCVLFTVSRTSLLSVPFLHISFINQFTKAILQFTHFRDIHLFSFSHRPAFLTEILASSNNICLFFYRKRIMTWAVQAGSGKVLTCTLSCFFSGHSNILLVHLGSCFITQAIPLCSLQSSLHLYIYLFIYSFQSIC